VSYKLLKGEEQELMRNVKCDGCDDSEPTDVVAILKEFHLCHVCRDYGTDKKISPQILTKTESIASQKEAMLEHRRRGANVYGEFSIVLH
jgi:hypothetical protein